MKTRCPACCVAEPSAHHQDCNCTCISNNLEQVFFHLVTSAKHVAFNFLLPRYWYWKFWTKFGQTELGRLLTSFTPSTQRCGICPSAKWNFSGTNFGWLPFLTTPTTQIRCVKVQHPNHLATAALKSSTFKKFQLILKANETLQNMKMAVISAGILHVPVNIYITETNINEKSAQRRHKHCVLAVVRWSQKFSPFPGGAGRPKFNHLEMVILPLPTNPVWWGSMHEISSYCGNRPTHTHPPTHRQDRLQYTALQLARSVITSLALLLTWYEILQC